MGGHTTPGSQGLGAGGVRRLDRGTLARTLNRPPGPTTGIGPGPLDVDPWSGPPSHSLGPLALPDVTPLPIKLGWKSNAPPTRYASEVQMAGHMRSILPRAFPDILTNRKGTFYWGVSRPVSDPSQGGHFGGKIPKTGKPVKCKAVDIYLDGGKPNEKKLGDALFTAFVQNRSKLGIDFVVWYGEKSDPDGSVRPYKVPKGKPNTRTWRHEDHLHVEFDPVTGDEDHSDALADTVNKVRDAIQ